MPGCDVSWLKLDDKVFCVESPDEYKTVAADFLVAKWDAFTCEKNNFRFNWNIHFCYFRFNVLITKKRNHFNSPRGVLFVLICVEFACPVENRAEPIKIWAFVYLFEKIENHKWTKKNLRRTTSGVSGVLAARFCAIIKFVTKIRLQNNFNLLTAQVEMCCNLSNSHFNTG